MGVQTWRDVLERITQIWIISCSLDLSKTMSVDRRHVAVDSYCPVLVFISGQQLSTDAKAPVDSQFSRQFRSPTDAAFGQILWAPLYFKPLLNTSKGGNATLHPLTFLQKVNPPLYQSQNPYFPPELKSPSLPLSFSSSSFCLPPLLKDHLYSDLSTPTAPRKKLCATRQRHASPEAGEASRALAERRSKCRDDRLPELIVSQGLHLTRVRRVFQRFVQPRYVDFISMEDMFQGLQPLFDTQG
ncbi:hypothetical protein Taro_022957 [Colocasia esculenta]|uniref:Uncharacterized protein n=1 Tax=Colocasia esculenta TaxID=4460 RepID=A0A843VD03_COLES|nr:hypothetical protein [Colocasia esculenta]